VGAKEPGLTPSTTEVSSAAEWLNMMLKEWQTTMGEPLWIRKTATVILEKGKQSYNLGTGTYAARGTVTETTTTAALAASDVVIPVTSSTGMSVGDNIGILLDDDTIHWDIILTVDTATQVTLTTGVASASSSGDNVWSYTDTAHRPLKIMEAIIRDSSDNDTPIEFVSQQEYFQISDKDSAGRPSFLFIDNQLGNSVLYSWPVMDLNDYKILYKYIKPYDDMDSATDDFEFPVEWTMAIVYGLAYHLCTSYNVDEQTYNRIARQASLTFKRANNFDIENTSIEFEVGRE